MDTVTETVASFNESALKAMNAFQEQVLAFHREAAAAITSPPELPSWVPTPESLPEVDVDGLVEQTYDFQLQGLQASKAFALQLIDIWTPKTPKAKATAKSTK
jgi:hypothetical protein